MRTIDVVIPCYNYARFLEFCVDSVMTQRDVDVRALIIDDASTDDTELVARRLTARYPNLDYRRHAENRRHIATFNEGVMEWASREYLLLLSADDALLPGMLSIAIDALEANPDAAFCHGAAIESDVPPPHLPDAGGQEPRVITGAEFWRELYQCAGNPIHTPTAVVRTACQHKVGGYRPEFHHTSDLHMWLKLATVGSVCEFPAPTAFKRAHAQNMSTGYNAIPLEDPLQVLAAFEDVWQLADRVGLEHSGLLASARETIAMRIFWEGSQATDRRDYTHADRCIAAARTIHPAIVQTPEFRRFQWKQRLGWLGGPLSRLVAPFRTPAGR